MPTDGDGVLNLQVLRPRRGTIVVAARGALDLASRDRFTELVGCRLSSTVDSLVLDLSGISFMSTAGVTALLDLELRARHRGVQLALTISDAVDRVLTLAEVEHPFTVTSTVPIAPAGAD